MVRCRCAHTNVMGCLIRGPAKRDPLGVMQDSKLLKEASIMLANDDGVSQSLTSRE